MSNVRLFTNGMKAIFFSPEHIEVREMTNDGQKQKHWWNNADYTDAIGQCLFIKNKQTNKTVADAEEIPV